MNPADPQQPLFPSFDSLEVVLWPGLAVIVFVATAIIVDVMIILAARFRLVDLPNKRSAHALPTARGGGAAIVVAATIASLVVAYRWPGFATRIGFGLIMPSLVIAVVGIIDDIRPLRPLLRLGIQIGVAICMTAVLGPVSAIALPGLPELNLGSLAWPLTIVWIVGMINAYNFMDGADGMAGLGAVVAGDVGSGFLGAIFAGIPLLVRDAALPTVFLPMAMALWPYIYDPFLSVLRRLWNRENPLEPHREFLFHRLVRSGVSHSRVSLIYGAMSLLGGLLGFLMVSNVLPEEVRGWLPFGVLALAAGMTYAIERRCSRVELTPVTQPVATV